VWLEFVTVAIIDYNSSIDCNGRGMASITIRNLDEKIKARLRIQAAGHGRSMEDEARDILRTALARKRPHPPRLAAAIRARFAPLGGVELPHPTRQPMRQPPEFEP